MNTVKHCRCSQQFRKKKNVIRNNWHVCHKLWVPAYFQTKNKLLWVASWPGAKMAAALPSFSDKTSAQSGDKHKPWRGTEEEATQITTATIQGFGGARGSRGHCLALVSYFVLLLKLFLGCGWHFSEQRRGKNTSNVSANFSSLRLLFKV